MKRLVDIILSFICLVLLIPVFLIISLILLVSFNDSIIFKQNRPGLNGIPFILFKFRTMTNELDEKDKLLPDKKRLTKFGNCLRKISLDELPSLWNVVKGDMSLVGPRPLLMEYLPLYSKEQMRRHKVKPGITGWAQINGRNLISWEEKFELDVWYVDNKTFWLDKKIILLTILKVLKREGINQSGHTTMEQFKGSFK